MKARTKLSPSRLGTIRSCQKCFYIDMNYSISRPRGIFPSLPSGMDGIFKIWFDGHREIKCKKEHIENKEECKVCLSERPASLPFEVKNALSSIKGIKLYPDQEKLNKMQNWRTGLNCTVNSMEVGGAIDDLLIDSDGFHYVFDFKTKGSEPKTDGAEYYQDQLNIYALMLEQNGFKMGKVGFLCYYYPTIVNISNSLGTEIVFSTKVCQLNVSAVDGRNTVIKAIELLAGPMPESGPECEYCQHLNALASFHNLEHTKAMVA